MNDLPLTGSTANSNASAPQPAKVSIQNGSDDTHSGAVSHGSKESAPISDASDRIEGLTDISGKEIELPKELQSAGVRIHPTTVEIPVPVAKLGVSPSGSSTPVQTTSSVVLPLSDDQIAIGLHEGVTNSVRWLAEWCVRRLKFLHITIKNVHGKFVRVQE